MDDFLPWFPLLNYWPALKTVTANYCQETVMRRKYVCEWPLSIRAQWQTIGSHVKQPNDMHHPLRPWRAKNGQCCELWFSKTTCQLEQERKISDTVTFVFIILKDFLKKVTEMYYENKPRKINILDIRIVTKIATLILPFIITVFQLCCVADDKQGDGKNPADTWIWSAGQELTN